MSQSEQTEQTEQPEPLKTTFFRIQGGETKEDFVITKVEVEKVGIEEDHVRIFYSRHMKDKCKKCAFCPEPASGYNIHKVSMGSEDIGNIIYVSFTYCKLCQGVTQEQIMSLFQRLIDTGKITEITKK